MAPGPGGVLLGDPLAGLLVGLLTDGPGAGSVPGPVGAADPAPPDEGAGEAAAVVAGTPVPGA
ncbi:hypothetical protein ACFVS6_35120, partial [Streptomyces sp. NPDC057939]